MNMKKTRKILIQNNLVDTFGFLQIISNSYLAGLAMWLPARNTDGAAFTTAGSSFPVGLIELSSLSDVSSDNMSP